MIKILCLETEWNLSKIKKMRNKASMLPLLKFLEQSQGVEYVFRNVASRADLTYYLEQLKYKTYKDFQIVYLSFHGSSKEIEIPNEPDKPMDFDELGKIAGDLLKDRIVHFGSCRTLCTSDEIIHKFKETTGARIVSGYSKTVDFIRSSILDLAYFSELSQITNLGAIEKRMTKHYDALMDELGLKIIRD